MNPNNTLLLMPDHGPRYAETELGRFPSEPANTLSNLVFLLVLVAALRRLRRERLGSPFYMTVVALLAVGWLGGTVYHATRSSVVWLALDFLPIALLCVLGAGRLVWLLPRKTRVLWFCGLLPTLVVAWVGLRFVPLSALRIGAGYSLLALLVATPALLHCREQAWRGAALLAGAVLSFAAALTFRFADARFVGPEPVLGTHFLWHLLGGCATYLILRYLLDAEAARGKTGG